MTTTPQYTKLLDTQGLYCPEPVMMLHGAIADINVNDVLKVLASDPSTQRDIPKFCDFLGHELLHSEQNEESFHYYILRKS